MWDTVRAANIDRLDCLPFRRDKPRPTDWWLLYKESNKPKIIQGFNMVDIFVMSNSPIKKISHL